MFCEKCGAELKENEQVCANCGAQNDFYKPATEEKTKAPTIVGMNKAKIPRTMLKMVKIFIAVILPLDEFLAGASEFVLLYPQLGQNFFTATVRWISQC